MTQDKNSKVIPNHVGIILDGNRRWAEERHLPNFEGHLKGYNLVMQSADWFFSHGVKVLSVFVFSSENWNRTQEEINYLMKIIKNGTDEQISAAQDKGYKILISGRIDELPGDLPESCLEVMNKTKGGKRGILNICFNYGGRTEIVDAIKKMIKNNIELEQVHEGMVRKYLYNSELPDVDIVVHTSGGHYLCGFQLWQSAYSELMFLKKYWPDFEEHDVNLIIEEFGKRKEKWLA